MQCFPSHLAPHLASHQHARKPASGMTVSSFPHHFCSASPLWRECKGLSVFSRALQPLCILLPPAHTVSMPNPTIQHLLGSVPNISLNSHPASVKILTALLSAPRASDPICITVFQVYFAYHFSTLAI